MTVLYGSSVADTTLTTACDMSTTTGGVETSKVTTYASGTGNFGEVFSLGTATAVAVTAIPATPTGHGWVYLPGAGTFALGNWSASITLAAFVNGGIWTLRFFKYTGTYSSIGTITTSITATAKTTYAFAATSMPATTFTATDRVYVDLWYNDTTGASGDNSTVYESTSSSSGVVSDMQITTSAFTAGGAVFSRIISSDILFSGVSPGGVTP